MSVTQYMAFGADAVGEPSTDGSAAASDFQALPTRSDAGAQEMANSIRIMQRFQTENRSAVSRSAALSKM